MVVVIVIAFIAVIVLLGIGLLGAAADADEVLKRR